MALPGAQALVQRGPIINVTVGLERSMATALIGQGAKVPIPVTGVALIDTGASVVYWHQVVELPVMKAHVAEYQFGDAISPYCKALPVPSLLPQ